MARGAPGGGTGAPFRGSAREQKVAARLREIARDRRALRNALDQFSGSDDFARIWASDDPDQINRRDQVERPYERVINHLQEVLEFCEAEDEERGRPAPAGNPGDQPGLWRRAALRGYLSHAEAGRWHGLALGRHRLAHHYADLPRIYGAEAFERAESLLADLPRLMRGLARWIDELWPRSER
jgi:hypothetical protein